MSKFQVAAPVRGTLLATATAAALLTSAGHAAAAPVVTGMDLRWVPNIASPTVTISGSGFTGATSVGTSGLGADSFTVVSDHTITAKFGYVSTLPVQVTAGGETSAPTNVARLGGYIGPDRGATAAPPVTCSLAGTGTSFTARLNTWFSGPSSSTVSAPAGTTYALPRLYADLAIPARPAGTPDPLAAVVGDATLTSLDVDAAGATSGTFDLAAGSPTFSAPVGTSVDGNALDFDVAGLAPSIALSPATGLTSLSLHGYHAAVTLAGGVPSSLDCVPSSSQTKLISIDQSGAPALNLALKGGIVMKSAAKGTVPLTGKFTGYSGLGGGTFTLAPTSARLTAYGFIPVTAAFTFTTLGTPNATLASDGTLSLLALPVAHVPSLRVLGVQLGGANCQEKDFSYVSATASAFGAETGGTLIGKFPINPFQGCGSNTNIATNLLSNAAHALTLKAPPIAPAAS